MSAPAPFLADDRRPRQPRSSRSFYSRVASEADKEYLEHAHEVTGLDEEIALLRAKLASAMAERPEDMDLLLRGIRLLVYAIQVRHRISPGAKQDLMGNLLSVIQGIGAQIAPAEDLNDDHTA